MRWPLHGIPLKVAGHGEAGCCPCVPRSRNSGGCGITDPDSGLFVKGGHKRQFAYEAHTACDANGFVLETVVTAGNIHDSVAFDDVYDEVPGSVHQAQRND